MSFTMIRKDIATMRVDAIVNAANTALAMGGGVCGAIFRAAGSAKLQAACDRLSPIETGGAVITSGFDLPARFVIHAAGPIYNRRDVEQCEKQLRSAYTESLRLARENGCESIAFPLISSGIYGYPKEDALRVAASAICDFLKESDLDVYLTVFDQETFEIGRKLLGDTVKFDEE